MAITLQETLDAETTERFLAVYRAGFDPLDPLAAGRQSLTDDEFRAEMLDPSVLKFLGADDDSEPVALLTASTNLDHVPWISPSFYRERFPDHAARNAIIYVGSLVVHPGAGGSSWMRQLTAAMGRYANERAAVVAFDCCQYNDESGFAQQVQRLVNHIGSPSLELVDTQSYYVLQFPGPGDHDPAQQSREVV